MKYIRIIENCNLGPCPSERNWKTTNSALGDVPATPRMFPVGLRIFQPKILLISRSKTTTSHWNLILPEPTEGHETQLQIHLDELIQTTQVSIFYVARS